MKRIILFLQVLLLSASCIAQTVYTNVQKKSDGTNALTGQISIPSAQTFAMNGIEVMNGTDNGTGIWNFSAGTIDLNGGVTLPAMGILMPSCSTIAALKALPVSGISTGYAENVLGYYSAGDAAGTRTYVYNSASSSTDNGGTIIAPNAGSGRWILSYSGAVNAYWFGCRGDNSTDDSAAILNLVAYANSLTPGGSINFPLGTFLYNQTASGPILLTQSNQVVSGYGGGTIKFTGTTGDCIKLTAAGGQQGVTNISLTDSGVRSSGYVVNINGGTESFVAGNVNIRTSWNGVGLTGTSALHYFLGNNTNITVAGASIGLDLQTSTSLIYGNGFALVGSNPVVTGSIGIRFPISVVQDTVVFSNFLVNSFDTGMSLQPTAGGACSDYYFSNFVVDQMNNGIVFNATGGAVCNRIVFNTGWVAGGVNGATGDGVLLNGAGYDVEFSNVRGIAGATGGAAFHLGATCNIDLISFNNCLADIGQYGYLLQNDAASSPGRVKINVGAATTTKGLTLGTAAFPNSVVVNNLDCSGSGTPLNNQSVLSTYGPTVVIRDCIGINPFGVLVAPSVPATTVTLVNPFPFDVTVYLTGGTVTIVKVSGTATGLTSGGFRLKVGSSITLTYSAPPTWTWFAD
jgi:hypothetical protein